MQRARATITYPLSGSAGVMTLYTKTTGPENSASAALCMGRLHDSIALILGACKTTTSFVSDSFVDTIDPATGTITGSDAVTSWTQTGTDTAGYAPPATAVVVGWKTDDIVAGRRVRGRTFISPITSGQIDSDGTPVAGMLAYANAFGAKWIDNGATAVYTCVWHRPKGTSPGSDHQITSYSVKDKFAVLRSRRD